MPLCGTSKLVGNLTRDCNVELAQGVEELVYIGHLADIETVVRDPTNPLIITSIVMKAGKKLSAYNYQAAAAIKPSSQSEETEYGNFNTETIVLPIIDKSADAKQKVQAIRNAKDLFVLFKQSGLLGDWEEFGIPNGLKGNRSRDDADAATNGAYIVTMTGRKRNENATIRHVTASVSDTDTWLASLANPIV